MLTILKYVGREKKNAAFTAFLMAVGSGFRVVHALLNALVLTALVSGKIHLFISYTLLDIGIFSVFCPWLILTDWQRAKTVEKMAIHLRADISRSLINRPYATFASRESGVYASWLTSDVATIEQKGFDTIFTFVQVITDPLFSIIALFHYHWSLVVLSLIVSLIMIEVPQLLRSKLTVRNLATTKQSEKLFSSINNQLQGYEGLFALGIQTHLVNAIKAASNRLLHTKMQQVKVEAVVNNGVSFLNILGQVAISAWTGILAYGKLVPIGAVNATGSLSYNILNCLAGFSPLFTSMQALQAIFAKYDLGKYQPSVAEHAKTLTGQSGAVTITDVNYTYPGKDAPVLRNVNMDIAPGQKVLITGESGCGKSTLLNILAGKIDDYTGTITVDDLDLATSSLVDKQQRVLYVSQRPYLFPGSIKDNLLLGDEYDDAAMQAALATADLTDYIASLPNGLDTEVGENGKNISGGQQQRIALARSLLRLTQRDVLLLDEVTNSLSTASAIKIEQNILRGTDATVIMVSHQLHPELRPYLDQSITMTPTSAVD